MKTINLLNKIANGEEVPKYIKYEDNIYEFDTMMGDYYSYKIKKWFSDKYCDGRSLRGCLNDEVEIIEEEKKAPTLNDIRERYGLPRIEEKKIPEKLETYKDRNNTIFLDDLCYKYMPIHKDSLSFNEQVIVDKLNEVLDYIKSKGE